MAVPAVPARSAVLPAGRRLPLAALCGAALALGQAPVSWPIVLFAAIPALLWLLDRTPDARAAFALGWTAGAGYFAAALFWIVEPFLVDPERHGWMAPFALAGIAGGLALFWGAPFALARVLSQPGLARALLLAALWSLFEYARSNVLTGFPWALQAYAWIETPVMQAGALVGPHGLGFVTIALALASGIGRGRGAAVAAVLVAAAWGWGALRLAEPVPPRPEPFVLRLVQPNAAQQAKWLPEAQMTFYQRHLAATRAEASPAPDVTIWSETAVPFVLGYADALQAEVAAAAPEGVVMLGIRRFVEGAQGGNWYNSLAILRPDGTPSAVYDKHHLVPFGEYVPFGATLATLGLPALTTLTQNGFSAGPGPRLLAAPGVPPFLPLICYEAIFPGAMQAPEGRPEWIVQVTNDAWFGTLSGPYQHFAQARTRAIEQGLPLARAANTGISAVVDARGRVVAELGLGEEGYLDAILPGTLPPPPYARLGDWPGLVAMLGTVGLTLAVFFGGNFIKARK